MTKLQDVTRAVRGSTLSAPARHILLTLATMADSETGEIAEEDTPSLTTLAGYTGLGRSTVAEQLNVLEELKWVERFRPTVADAWANKARTRYRLAVGTSPGAGLVQDRDQSRTRTSPPAGPPDVSESDSSTSPGAGLVQELDTLLVVTPSSGKEPSSSSKPKLSPEPPRADVERVCRHLADAIERNGSKRPTITKRWRSAARLLIDNDRRTVDQVVKAIDWCQSDDFWRSNILSMPKLREKYDQMRLKALADARAAKAASERSSAGPTTPASNAPKPIPKDDACPRHPYERAANCGACASERLAARKGA